MAQPHIQHLRLQREHVPRVKLGFQQQIQMPDLDLYRNLPQGDRAQPSSDLGVKKQAFYRGR